MPGLISVIELRLYTVPSLKALSKSLDSQRLLPTYKRTILSFSRVITRALIFIRQRNKVPTKVSNFVSENLQ